jgi:arginyl-tRNA synthetase
MKDNTKQEGTIYPITTLENKVQESLFENLPLNLKKQVVLVETPPQFNSDFGIQLTGIAKLLKTSPVDLATEATNKGNEIKDSLFEKIENQGPFLNLKLNMGQFGNEVISSIFNLNKNYGKENVGKGQKVVIDMSAPNIAKRMNYGHLRSTIIGDSLANIYKFQGYDVIRDNHLGDWGTQFGKLITAIKLWGNEKELLASEDPIGILQDLYVKFHAVAEEQAEVIKADMKAQVKKNGFESIPELQKAVEEASKEIMTRKKIGRDEVKMDVVLEDALDRVIITDIEKEGRDWFRKLEAGDPEAKRLWEICIDLSMKEFNQIYKTLGVDFELILGESFYEDKLQNIFDEVSKSKYGEKSEGALIINLEDKELGVAIIQKQDGASVYMTRDLATAEYRETELKADKIIYVVGEDQKQYFQQLFEILKRLGHEIGDKSEHVYFGMVRLPEGKMSTRKGRTILLRDVISEGLKKAEEIIQTKNPELAKDEETKNEVVRQIAIGALKWNDLGQDPKHSIEFRWEKALNFDGYGSPYVQYTAVRAKSILESAEKKNIQYRLNEFIPGAYSDPIEKSLIRKLAEFPKAIALAQESSNPSQVAIYVFELSKRFSTFYNKLQVLKAESSEIVNSRLKLVAATVQVIENSLGLLGIEVPKIM